WGGLGLLCPKQPPTTCLSRSCRPRRTCRVPRCERRVYVYVRQSSPKQVQHNRESQANQYALVQRARDLGWPPDRIHVIDADLGVSSQDAERAGFQELVAAVSLGHAGLVLAYEASRLARNNAEWYRLLEVATLVGT